MYNREAKLPIDIEVQQKPTEGLKLPNSEVKFDEMSEMIKIRERVTSAANENIVKAQARQKKHYNKKHKHDGFEVGGKVLLRNSREDSCKGGKLKNPWTGPYTIVECFDKGLYKLSDNGKILKCRYNSARLIKYMAEPTKVDVDIDSRLPGAAIRNSLWLPSLQLNIADQNVILNNEPLNDKIINAAQVLLKEKFPHIKGFQDILLKDTSFSRQSGTAYKSITQVAFTGCAQRQTRKVFISLIACLPI